MRRLLQTLSIIKAIKRLRGRLVLPAVPTDDEVADLIRSVPAHHATTYDYSGTLDLAILASATAGEDISGSLFAAVSQSLAFAATGGDAPTISGFLHGAEVTCAAGDWLLASATDPFGGMGDAVYPAGFLPSATAKLKLLFVANTDTTNTITVARGASAGLTIFAAASDAVTIQPGSFFLYYDKTGATSGTLTTTTNDKVTIAVGGGAPTAEVVVLYGP